MTTVISPVLPVPTPADRVYGCTRLCVVEFGGADPTGKVDSTAAIQKCIDALPKQFGGEVHVPKGTYLVDAVTSINLRDNMWFHMEPDAVLTIKSNDQTHYGILTIQDAADVLVTGGTLVGDRATHTFAPQKVASQNTHEWGHGIRVYRAARVTIQGVTVKDCTGDGSSLDGAHSKDEVNDIFFKDFVVNNTRRQGISVGRVTGVVIQGGEIANVNGTAPQCGIDIEPETGSKAADIYIDGVHIHDCKANAIIGVKRSDVTSTVSNVQVSRCVLEHNGACGIYTIAVNGIEVFNNRIVNNGQTGLMISAGTTGLHAAENTFGFNYNRGKTGKDRVDFTQFGVTKAIEMDILVRNTDSNDIGKNYYI